MESGFYEGLSFRLSWSNRRMEIIWWGFYSRSELFWVEKYGSMLMWSCYCDFVVVYRGQGGSPKSPDGYEYFEHLIVELARKSARSTIR